MKYLLPINDTIIVQVFWRKSNRDCRKLEEKQSTAPRFRKNRDACRFLAERYTLTDNDIVLTHDAVRPFINSRIIRENIAAVNEYGAANTVMPIFDSVIRSFDGEFISDALSRKNIYRVQTPQSFKALQLNTVINSLSQEELEKFTDVASVFSERGFRVKLVTGDDSNIKITTPFDLAVAEAVLQNLP